jgi:Spy/CpxP family protein refolding chaperone
VWGPDRDRYQQMLDSLKLTQEQRAQVDKILGDARTRIQELQKQSQPGMQEVRQQTDERLQAVLTPEQWGQFRQMRDEMRERRHRERGWR